jgi:hypothetical protein
MTTTALEGGTTMTDVRQRTEGVGQEDELRDHAKEAHVHDHTVPTESPAGRHAALGLWR